jgi:PAS domain S-box-containing protein
LHLEDSPLDADLIRARLVKEGLRPEIQRVDSRDDFAEGLRQRPLDLILADYSLPSFDGLEALELARVHAPDTPFLFVSGVIGEDVAIESLKRGATDYVLKHRLERLGPAVQRALTETLERVERRRAEAALRESERRHRLTLDSVRDYAILTMDTQGRITGCNAGAERVLGFREDELVGRPASVFYTPEDVEAGIPRRELDRAGARGVGDDERWYLRKDGTRFWGSGLVMPLLDEAGQLQGFTKVVRDVSERKQAEEALREADRRKDEFLAMLAHELRNPLSAIHNASQLTRKPDLPLDKLAWAHDVIAHQVRHLAHLVDDLLDVSRITRGKVRLRREPLDLAAILASAVDVARPSLQERDQRLELAIEPGPLRVEGDPVRLEQVFINLLANAVKYTEPGGTITLSARDHGDGRVVASVRDDGVGIDSAMLPLVFDLFTQVDRSLDRSQGGLGIGLTIVRRLVEMHGGTIRAESDGPGRGSTFLVELPSAIAPPKAVPAPPDSPARPVPPGSRVLVVDDNLHTATALAGLLEISGFLVRSAHDGREALRVARDHRPDAILLDIGLPGMDGYQVAEHLRREDSLRDATLIAITGYGEEQALRRSREAGFNHHLVKPVNYDTLLGLLVRDRHRADTDTDTDQPRDHGRALA